MVILNKSLKPVSAVEIKWSNRFFTNPLDLKSMLYFCEKNNIKDIICTTINMEGMKTINGINIHYFSNATYALTVGRNTLIQKQNK
jgi:uncharacterized protein